MKTKTFFKIAAGAALILGLAFPALAQHANVPVLSTNFVKPNVMIMLDTSGSMLWDLNGNTPSGSTPSRITIAKRVLTGEGMVAYTSAGSGGGTVVNVYLGQTGGTNNYNLWTQYLTTTTTPFANITTPYTKIMRLSSCTSGCTYKPDPNGTYFVFADNDDVMFASAAGTSCTPGTTNCPNTPANMTTASTAFTTLDLFLLQQNMFGLEIVNHTDIRDGGTTSGQLVKPRDVYQAVTTSPPPVYPRDVFIQHFADVYNIPTGACTWSTATPPVVTCPTASTFEAQPTGTGTPLPMTVTRTSRVFPVISIAGTSTSYCWRTGSGTFFSPYRYNGCYVPNASGDYFVFMDGTDYDVAMSDADDKAWPVSLPLRDYLSSKNTSSYKWYSNNLSVCGDSTGTCASSADDGRSGNRIIYQWVATNTSGATVFRNTDPTDAEVRTEMVKGIPQVQLTDVISPDGRYGPDFIFKTPYNGRLEYAVRMGLGIPQPTTNDILDTLNRGLTYVKSNVIYHFLNGKDAANDGTFDGLTYDIAYYEKNPGLLDVYTNIRWGLADLDGKGDHYSESNCPGTDSDFPTCGARIVDSLPDEYTAATSAATANAKVQVDINAFAPDNSTPLASAMRDMYLYFFANALKADLLKIAGRNDTTPTMYVDQNCSAADANEGHVVQDEKAYINGCRKNFLIFFSDGDQTSGIGCPTGNGSASCPLAGAIAAQTPWVTLLKQNGDYFKGVKVFLIGFALNGNANAIAELNAMALASKMDANDKYTTAFFADNEAGLKAALTTIFNAIMEGDYTRSAPKTDAKETVEADGYFTVKPDEPMWEGHLELYDLTQASTPAQLATLMPLADGASVLNQTLTSDRDIFTAEPASGSTVWAYYHGSKVKWNKVDFITTNAATLLADMQPGEQNGDTHENKTADASALITFITATKQNSPQAHFKPDVSPLGTNRTWTLGAINRSVPLMVGPPGGTPSTNFLNYGDFQSKHSDRPTLIYVGANDGMLHAFFKDDLNGTTRKPVRMEEAFAYIPHAVLGTLKYLRENQWYYVDATPVAADIFIPKPTWVTAIGATELKKVGCADLGGGQVYCWRTVLVSGLGPGGREVFALDVTDQDTISAANTSSSIPAPKIHTLWEFSDKIWNTPPTERLGDSWSLPFLAELRQGDGNTTSVAAIFGGGWGAEGEYNVGNYIYFVNVNDASILRRYYIPDKEDPNWKTKMDAGRWLDNPASPFLAENNLPGDAAVVDVPDQEGLSELLYIGDLQGRVWKVNMANGDTTEWKACLFYDTGDRTGIGKQTKPGDPSNNDNLPLKGATTYAAFDALRRPVFYAPTVVPAPKGGLLVIFGTGHIEESSVARDEGVVNCIFAVWDKDPIDGNTICSYGTLWNSSKYNTTDCPQCVANISYPYCFQPGEKLISKPSISEGLLSFQTFKPYSDNHCDLANYNPCEPGIVRDWFVDYLTFYGILHLGTTGSQGRYLQQTDFTASGLTLTNKFGYIYTIPGGGVHGFTPPTGKSSDILSWGEGMSFTW